VLVVSVLLVLPAFVWPGGAESTAAPGVVTVSRAHTPPPVLRVFPAETTPGHEISLSGTLGDAIARPFAVQRKVGRLWRGVFAGVSDRRGHFGRVWQAPNHAGVKRYRVVAPRHRVGTKVYPRRLSTSTFVTIAESTATATDSPPPVYRWLPHGQLGSPYAVALGVPTDPPGTWALDDGNPPNGLRLNPNGILKGTPAGVPGTQSFSAKFTDGYGVSVRSYLRLRVGRPPTVVPRDPGFSNLLAYDNFQPRPDQPLVGTATDSGHMYDSYQTGTYSPYVLDGAYRIDPAAPTWDGWSFVTLPEEQVPTSVGARFFFDKPRHYGAQEVVLVLWRPDSTVAESSVQFMAKPGGWAMFKVIDGYRIYAEKGGYTTFPRQDGTVYEMSMHLDRSTNTVTVNLPDGTVKSWTDPDYSTFWGSTFAVQIRRTTSSGDAGVTAIFSGV
jgi:hypothetical protein